MDAYEYHLILDIRATVDDAIRSERRASAKDAEMMRETNPKAGGRGH